MTYRHTLLLLVSLCACRSVVALPGGEDDASSDSSTSGSDPAGTSAPTPPDDPSPMTTTDPFDPTTGGWDDSTGGSSCGFVCDSSDTAGDTCDLWEQDCPEGEKCNPWANDGGASWNALRCVPIDPNPDGVGEPCTVDGSAVSGIDSCVFGAMCWDVDPDTGIGTCQPHCTGSPRLPVCEDPNRWCALNGDGTLALCLPYCDPLDPETCPEDSGCYRDDEGFVCALDDSGEGGGAFEACEFSNACDPGLSCESSAGNDLCDPAAPYCCTPHCALSMPVCPDALTCVPYFDEGTAPPLYDDLGLCVGDAQ